MNSRDADDLKHNAANAGAAWPAAMAPLRRLQFAVMAVLILFWSAVVIIVVATFSLTAWGDRGGPERSAAPAREQTATPSPTEVPRPSGVPSSAQMVDNDVVLGDVSDAIYFFRDSQCAGDLLIVSTTKAVIYAETPCANIITPEYVRRLVGQPVRVRLVARRLFVEALFVNSFQFDVERVWVDAR
ncbi:MAG: hypothetical protein M3P30_15730 [Chloroflexota bacterium]|nr:hypothetical protein [Chloroflexota bacterium]